MSAYDDALVEVLFNDADKDKSGFLELPEFKALLATYSGRKELAMSDAEVDEALNGLDANADGKLSKDEFAALIKKLFHK